VSLGRDPDAGAIPATGNRAVHGDDDDVAASPSLEPLAALLDYAGELASATEPGPLDLRTVSAGRLHIRRARPGLAIVAELLEWLGTHPEVTRVVHRDKLALIEVDYRDVSAARSAAFVRSVRDHLFTLNQPHAGRRSSPTCWMVAPGCDSSASATTT
jgi:hypothetical protein